MKSEDIVKVFAKELGTADILELNKLLKAKTSQNIKYKIMGKKLGYLGYTVAVKNITTEGLKIFDIKKVILIKFSDIDSFEKAKPRVKRPVAPKKVKVAEKIEKKPISFVKAAPESTESTVPPETEEPNTLNASHLTKFKKKKHVHKGSAYIPNKKSR